MAEQTTTKKSAGGAKRGRPKGSGAQKSAGKKTAGKKGAPSQMTRREKRINELILAIVLLAVGIFLIISLQTQLAGAVGAGIRTVLMGCFGNAALILPYYFILYSILLFIGRAGKTGAFYSSFLLAGLFLLIALFYSILCTKENQLLSFGSAWLEEVFTLGAAGTGGGAVGMSLAYGLVKLFGKAGACIITAALMAIVILIVANEPFAWLLGKHRAKQRERAIAREKKRNEEWIREQEEQQQYEKDMALLRELTQETDPPDSNFGKKRKIMGYMKAKEEALFGKQNDFEQLDISDLQEPVREEGKEVSREKEDLKEEGLQGAKTEEGKGQDESFSKEEPEPPEEAFGGGFGLPPEAEYMTGSLAASGKAVLKNEAGPEKDEGTPERENEGTGEKETNDRETGGSWDPEGQPAIKPDIPPKKEKMDQKDMNRQIRSMDREISKAASEAKEAGGPVQLQMYALPPIDLLKGSTGQWDASEKGDLQAKAALLERTLQNFNVGAKVVHVSKGPAVTRFEIQPAVGVKVSSIVRLADDIALNLAAKSIRMEAPIPGKAAVGIEVENNKINAVLLRDVIDSEAFRSSPSKITFAVGEDISGNPVVANLKDMPHLLIAGSTGSGKSVCINSIIISLLYKARPDEVKIILIDPKVVELSNYNGIPHLMIPVVNEPSKAAVALNWAVAEMNDRYRKFAAESVKDLASYNRKMQEKEEEQLPQIVIIIDELADLMMAAPQQVEDAICRLAQMARAAGMHLIVATQRPSVDIITGVIKANIPSRIAFAVSSQIDSRTILDMAGAERLVGKGDMLFNPIGRAKPLRVQGTLVTDDEVERVIQFVKNQGHQQAFSNDLMHTLENASLDLGDKQEETDELLRDAIEVVVNAEQASVSMLQRRFRIGYNRAARLVDMMEERGIVGPADGSRPRKVFLTREGLAELDQAAQRLQEDGEISSRDPEEPAPWEAGQPFEGEEEQASFLSRETEPAGEATALQEEEGYLSRQQAHQAEEDRQEPAWNPQGEAAGDKGLSGEGGPAGQEPAEKDKEVR